MSNKYKKKFYNILLKIIVILGVFALWQVMSIKIDNPIFLPTPKSTFEFLVDLAEGDLLGHTLASFKRITIAVCLAEAISIPLSILSVTFKPVNNVVETITGLLNKIPLTAFIPIYILMIGLDERYKVQLVFTAVFLTYFPIIKHIFETPNPHVMELAQTMGFSKARIIYKFLIPYSLPELCVNFVGAYGIGWTYVILAESSNTVQGLGHLMYIGNARGNMRMVFAALITIILVNILFSDVFTYFIKKGFSWRYKDSE